MTLSGGNGILTLSLRKIGEDLEKREEKPMAKSKKYFYDYDMAEEGKGPRTMIPEILADSEFPSLTAFAVILLY